MLRLRVCLTLLLVNLTLSGCGILGGKTTIVQITNKITSLPAGQPYQFMANVQHDQMKGVTLSLTGAGTLVLNGATAIYLAPPAPPTPNSVTVTVTAGNGSGVKDSDTFSITAAAGPVVSILPTTPTVTAGGAAVTLNIAVTSDDPSDILTVGVSSSSICKCRSLWNLWGHYRDTRRRCVHSAVLSAEFSNSLHVTDDKRSLDPIQFHFRNGICDD